MNEIYFNWLDIGDKDLSCGTQQNSDHIKDTNAIKSKRILKIPLCAQGWIFIC
jgi:hypothetical protein